MHAFRRRGGFAENGFAARTEFVFTRKPMRVSRSERLISANSKVWQGRERRRATREPEAGFVLREQCPSGCAFGLPNCLITGDTANRRKG